MNRTPKHTGNTEKQETDTPTPRDAPSSAFASVEESVDEMSPPLELQGNYRQDRERRELRENDEEEDASSSDEEMRPGAVAVAGVFNKGRISSSVSSESQGSSVMDEQSTIMGELAEPSHQVDTSLRRRYQELQKIVNETVTGTAIVENSGAADHDQNTASSPFGRNERRFLIGAVFVLLLVVGVILGVAIPLTINNNNNKDSTSIDSVVTPTQSTTPTKAPTAAPSSFSACTSLDCIAEILLQKEVTDAEALQVELSPQFLALRWLANNDTAVLTSAVTLVERYVLAVFYFATSAESGLNVLKSVCEWKGVSCNQDDLVVALLLGKSKHEEGVVLISTFRIDSPLYLPFSFSVVGE
jgi:hypothetical protein